MHIMPLAGRLIFTALAALPLLWASAGGVIADDGPLTLSQGPLTFTLHPYPRGMQISVDGVSVVKSSNQVVTKPPWAPHYYLGPSAEALRSAQREVVEDGVRLRLKHSGEQGAFAADETFKLTNDGRLEHTFEGRFLLERGEALVQWQLAALNPAVLIGRPYRAASRDGKERAGVVPVIARHADTQKSLLADKLGWIEFDARIGKIRIEVESDRDVVCYDHRKNQWADPNRPLFWLGDLGSRCKPGDTLRYRVVYHLPLKTQPSSAASAAALIEAVAQLAPRPQAQLPAAPEPRVIPRPKQASYREQRVPLLDVSGTALYATEGLPQSALAEAELERWRRTLSSRAAPASAKPAAPAESPPGSPPSAKRPLKFIAAPPESIPESYTLEIAPERITVSAIDERGFLYGVQTLKQLALLGADLQTHVPAATIRDWPSLAFRGVHLFTGGQGPALHESLLQNVLGPLKLNQLVLQAEYIKWDGHENIHHAEWGMSKADVRQVLRAARAQGLEVIPLVMSLGHCQWMFHNDQNLDLAEDPQAKWAYCVTNPKTYDFIFDVYTQALELFEPKVFHIGHDEFTDRGRVPFRESSKSFSIEELFMTDLKRHHEWFRQRGVRIMIWGDMLLTKGDAPDACHAPSPEAARRMREALPDDVWVADWHYAGNPPADFKSLGIFHAGGNQTVASSWSRPQNIVNFARAAFEQRSAGLLQTTWAGYSLDPQSFKKELRQYMAYVLAAEAAWNADQPPLPAELPYQQRFLDLMQLNPLKTALRSGWCAALGSVRNTPLRAADADGWLGLGPEHDLSNVPRGLARLGGIEFDLGDPPAGLLLAHKLAGARELPRAARIELQARADRLAILHVASFACEPSVEVGRYEIEYEDGAREPIVLRYGENIHAYDDVEAAVASPLVWRGQSPAGTPVALRALLWENPRSGQTIRSLRAESANADGGLLLLAVTGLSDQAATAPGSAP